MVGHKLGEFSPTRTFKGHSARSDKTASPAGARPHRLEEREAMVRAEATARYIRTSAQKAGLVLDLIRNKDVNQALIDVAVQPQVGGARRREGAALRGRQRAAAGRLGGDVARLFVSGAFANNGPSQKRVRPAPMGRAFRIIKRTTHLTVQVTERAQVIKAVGTEGAGATAPATKAKSAKSTKAGAKKQPAAAAAE